jgi:hypothetical protein
MKDKDKKDKDYLELLLLNLLREKEFRKKYTSFVSNQKKLFESSFVAPSIYPDAIHVNIGNGLVAEVDAIKDLVSPMKPYRDNFYNNYMYITSGGGGV